MADSKICVECGKDSSPYKCPTCIQRYCSVTCCRSHKTKNCQKPVSDNESSENVQPTYLYPTEDTIDVDKLKELEYSDELKKMLKDPTLRKMLTDVQQEAKPEKLLKQCMQDQGFMNFVDTVLNIIEPSESNENSENLQL